VWQEAVKPYVAAGRLVAIGLVQEQHPDRTMLYRQWRELDWPIAVAAMNTQAHIQVVPVPIGIDEMGIVQRPRFNPSQLDEFMATEYEMLEIASDYNRASAPDVGALWRKAEASGAAGDWRKLGEAIFNFGATSELDAAVEALEKAVEADPSDGYNRFSLGAALRRRYETPGVRRVADAQSAVERWAEALEIDPNHYIRRRRLQQYGPRLDQPYDFYYWVVEARRDIRARGEKPHVLTAEPTGAEILAPRRRGESGAESEEDLVNRDPEGRIVRDERGLVQIETMMTPPKIRPGKRLRARVTFRLNEATHPYWNNEADDLMMWAGLPEGLSFGERQMTFPNPETPETQELRQVEFEIVASSELARGSYEIPAYALYYVCEDEGGVCYYFRQDFTLSVEIDPEAREIIDPGRGRGRGR
jgi:tetratricopeptide (TPR) repeat protein